MFLANLRIEILNNEFVSLSDVIIMDGNTSQSTSAHENKILPFIIHFAVKTV